MQKLECVFLGVSMLIILLAMALLGDLFNQLWNSKRRTSGSIPISSFDSLTHRSHEKQDSVGKQHQTRKSRKAPYSTRQRGQRVVPGIVPRTSQRIRDSEERRREKIYHNTQTTQSLKLKLKPSPLKQRSTGQRRHNTSTKAICYTRTGRPVYPTWKMRENERCSGKKTAMGNSEICD